MERNTLNLKNLPSIDIDYSDLGHPAKARKLKPHILVDGEVYYAIYGPDPQVGIFGWGGTPLEAIEDWENELEQRIEKLTEGDNMANEVISQLGGTNI